MYYKSGIFKKCYNKKIRFLNRNIYQSMKTLSFILGFGFFFLTIYEGLDEVLILEDDAIFEPYFRFKLQMVLNELRRLKVSWDLV